MKQNNHCRHINLLVEWHLLKENRWIEPREQYRANNPARIRQGCSETRREPIHGGSAATSMLLTVSEHP